jgi:hypothetical protein
MAENFTQKDIIVVALGYNLAPNGSKRKLYISRYLNSVNF